MNAYQLVPDSRLIGNNPGKNVLDIGVLMAEQGLYEEAADVFNADLLLHPNNGWALKGLTTCYQMTEQHQKAKLTEELFSKSWSRSDIKLKAACFCSKGNTI